MKNFIKKALKIFSIAVLLAAAFLPAADAAIRLEVQAGEDGFSLKYNIPVIGRANVSLESPGESDTLTLRIMAVKLAEVELTLNEITTAPDIVSLHYVVSSRFMPGTEVIEGDIPIPFGDFGVTINLSGKKLIPTGDSNIDVALLLANEKTDYDININIELNILGQELQITESFSGSATPDDNLIHEQVLSPLDDSVLMDINIEVQYPNGPFTVLNYEIVSSIPSFEETQEDDDAENGGLLEGSITVPNGSYHVWADLDLQGYLPALP